MRELLRVVPLAFQAFLMGGIENPISAVLRSGRVTFARGRIYAGGIIRKPGQRSRGRLRTGLHMQNASFSHRRPVPPAKIKIKINLRYNTNFVY
jgi:hypothetical protein